MGTVTKKILWIDDMQDWANITQLNLQTIASDQNITLAIVSRPNGDDLDFLFENIDFDLIVMDYQMEPMNGDAYIRQIREKEHLTTIPIIFYSQRMDLNLEDLILGVSGVETVHRPNLEDKILDLFDLG